MALKGIDVSRWQTATPSLDGLAFVVVKASQGTTKDPMWDSHYAACRRAGVVTMAYHWGTDAAVVPIADQVAAFLAIAKDADFLWLDQEEQGFSDAEAQAFIDAVRAAGRRCGLYHSSSGFGGVNADAKWVADYRAGSVTAGFPRTGDGSKELPGWDFWQWQGNPLDADYMNPASPLAAFLREGYIPEAIVTGLHHDIADLTAELATKSQQALDLASELAATEAELAAAPGIERERIAEVEAARIRSL